MGLANELPHFSRREKFPVLLFRRSTADPLRFSVGDFGSLLGFPACIKFDGRTRRDVVSLCYLEVFHQLVHMGFSGHGEGPIFLSRATEHPM